MLQYVKSNINPEVVWIINTTNELHEDDVEFISSYNPMIYWNDLDCKYWCFDRPLPSGKWLEHIEMVVEVGQPTTFKGLVI